MCGFWGPIHMHLVCIWYLVSVFPSLCFSCVFSGIFYKIIKSTVVFVFFLCFGRWLIMLFGGYACGFLGGNPYAFGLHGT